MVKELFIVLLFLLMIFPVLAGEFTVNVNTLPGQEVGIFILEPIQTWSRLDSYTEVTDSGLVSKSFSISGDEVHMRVIIKDAGKNIKFNELYENHPTKGTKNLYFGVEPPEEEIETKESEEEIPIEKENEQDDELLTGAAVITDTNQSSGLNYAKIGIYSIIIAAVLAIILFITKLAKSSKNKNYTELELSDAENRVRTAGEEIARIKERKKRMNEVQEQLRREQEELERLRKEDY